MSKSKNSSFVLHYVVTDDSILPLGYSQLDIKIEIKYGKKVKYIPVEVSEEVYREFAREEEKEHKRRQREVKCWIAGRRCKKSNCSTCPSFTAKHKGGAPLSLNKMIDDGLDVVDSSSYSPEQMFEEEETLKELMQYIESLSNEDRILANAILDHTADRVLMEKLGIKNQSTLNSKKMRIKAQMQDVLKDFR